MKMFGDMSSMASFFAAAALVSSGKTVNHSNMDQNSHFLNGTNFQMNPSHGTNTLQSPHPDQASVLAAVYKYNYLYNNIPQLQSHQQNYSASLAKCMSYYYNKPLEYIQRVLAEQSNYQGFGGCSNSEKSIYSPTPSMPILTQQTSLPQNSQLSGIQQKINSFRYHPYMKNTHSPHQGTLNTNSSPSSPTSFSPKILQQIKKQTSRSPSPVCSIPSPVENHRAYSVQSTNDLESTHSLSISSSSHSSLGILSPKEKSNQK